MTPAAIKPQDVTEVVPAWVGELLAAGGRHKPWITIPDALPYLSWSRHKVYRMADAYLRRLGQERKRRHSVMVPVDVLYARDGEIACERDGRSIVLSKRLLIIKLVGYLPLLPGNQP